MVKPTASPILQLIRRVADDLHARELPDHELLQRFHTQRDQAAFHALLRRHGPMVLDVCRAVLANEADTEDAFQATFLVLARKARSIKKAASLASWLHGVAYRSSIKARAQSLTRQKHEARVPLPQASPPDDLRWREVQAVLHEELNRLSEQYRVPLVLCYLDGKTQEQAAGQLGLAKSTLRQRLERGREVLRARLLRRGLGPAALLTAAAWPAPHASAGVPLSLLVSTAKAAAAFAAGSTAAAVGLSANAAALTEGLMKAMLLTRLKIAALAGVLVITGLGVGHVVLQVQAADPPKEQRANEKPPGPKSEAPDLGGCPRNTSFTALTGG